MDSGHGQVQGGLLVGLEAELGQVVRRRGRSGSPAGRPPRSGRSGRAHPRPKQGLVPLECLSTGAVPVRIAGDTVGDLAQAERPDGVEQHQQQVGDPFEPVELRHRGQSRVRSRRGLAAVAGRDPMPWTPPVAWAVVTVGVAAVVLSATCASSARADRGPPVDRKRWFASPSPCVGGVVALTWPVSRLGRPLVAHRARRPASAAPLAGGPHALAGATRRRAPPADPTGRRRRRAHPGAASTRRRRDRDRRRRWGR